MTTQNLPAITLEITADTAPAIFKGEGLGQYFDHIKASVNEVPDLSSKKGRDRIASLAAQVSRSKTAVEKPGRDYLKRIKELPKQIEAELRDFVNNCDALRDQVRQPLTDWEAEQERIEAEKKAAEAAIALAKQIESDWEIAVLLDREFDRAREEKRQAAIKAQQERDAEIARQAAEQARLDAENAAKAERESAARRELDAKMAQERAEREAEEAKQRAIEAEQRAVREKAEAEERAARQKVEAEARAKLAAEQAAAAERRRIELEAQQQREEQERRERNKRHCAAINNEALNDLMLTGLTEDQAKSVVTAIAKGKVRNVAINY